MQLLSLALIVLAAHADTGAEGLVAAYAAQAKAKATPVQKVIELMNGMLEKGEKEMKAEQIQFATYKQFCEDTTADKQKAIKEATEMIETLKADIAKYAADAEMLGKEIAQHEEDIAVWNGDEKAAYDAMHKDYSESIDALERAIQVLKKQAYDR